MIIYFKGNKNPGVGVYNISIENKKAVYKLSNFKSSLPISFGTELRNKSIKATLNPGPGSYNLPSDFKWFKYSLLIKIKV